MQQNTLIIVFGISIIFLGLVIILLSIRIFKSGKTSDRIQTFILKEQNNNEPYEITYNKVEFSESLIIRMIIPILKNLIAFLGKITPANKIAEINRKLSLAGIFSIKGQQYYGIRFSLFLLSMIWFFFDITRNPDIRSIGINVGIMVFIFILPILWVNIKSQKRQEEIKKSLPDALDILSISTSAGLGFDQALLKVSQVFNSASGQEFARVASEIEVGVSRQEALKNFSERVQVSEISSFVAVIIQSELLGMSISDVLHTQAEQMRIQRQYWIKEMAQKLPVKMMFPLAFLILPALLAVLLGPTVPKIMSIF